MSRAPDTRASERAIWAAARSRQARVPLEGCIDKDVREQGRRGEQDRRAIHERRELGQPSQRDRPGEHCRLTRGQPTRRERAHLRPPHQRVKISLSDLVERVRPASDERGAEQRVEQDGERNRRTSRRRRWPGDEIARGNGQNHEGHDPRLRQREEIGRCGARERDRRGGQRYS